MKRLLLLIGLLASLQGAWAQKYFGVPDLNKGWGIGIGTGLMTLNGDVRAFGPGYAGEIWIQRKTSRVVDAKFSLSSGINFGLDLSPSRNILYNPALNGTYNPAIAYDTINPLVFHNYRHWGNQLAFGLRFNLNRMVIREGADNWDLYVSAGIAAYLYNTKSDLTNAQGAIYDYSNIPGGAGAEAANRLTSLLDGTYESFAQNEAFLKPVIGNFIVNSSLPLAAGVYFRTGDNWGLGLEAQYILSQDDLLDGQMWDKQNQVSTDRDAIGRAFFVLGYHW